MALAKAELRQSGTRAGKGIGLFAGAAVAGMLFLVFLSVSAWWGLGQYIGNEWSALVVAAVWAIVAVILALGRQEGAGPHPRAPADHRDPRQGSERIERPRGGEPMTTSNDPDEIRAEIERTRAALSDDVDALTDTANPKKIAQRQVDKAKDAVVGVKDRVMGSADDARTTTRAAERRPVVGPVRPADVQDKASAVGDAVTGAPAAAKQKTRGNPLAAGLIAFGAGLLISSLFPSSQKEQEAVSGLQEKARAAEGEGAEAAKDVGAQLKEPAQEAVESVKSTAAEGAQNVKDEGVAAKDDVQSQVQDSKATVQDQVTS